MPMDGVPLPADRDDVTFEVLMRDPYFTDAESGEVTPMVAQMQWSALEIKDHNECVHEHTVCDKCGDDWELDHYVRITYKGNVEYVSPDAPGQG